jgi:hypothetical protein
VWPFSTEQSSEVAIRLGLFVLIFLAGWFEGWATESRDIPKYTWGIGLMALVIWIGLPLTAVRLVLASVILVTGVLAIRWYERRAGDPRR